MTMSTSGSRLSSLLSTHDLGLACSHCCTQEKEITYTLKSVNHQCARNVLLCRAKGASKWRPVSRRPEFPNPSQYLACWYFVEGSGCTQHKNRCTFARSDEEAVVWTFEKSQRLDRTLLRKLIIQLSSERGANELKNTETPSDLLAALDLKAACEVCCTKKAEITYTVKSVMHKCARNQILAKSKDSDQWRPVSERPTAKHINPNILYRVCDYFVEGSGCVEHKQSCTYGRSYEEATVWNYMKKENIDRDQLVGLLAEAESVSETPERAAEMILQQFCGEFIELCKDCFHERPQKLTPKRWNNTCAADAAHTWDPVLVYHLSENNRKHIYSEIRPIPPNCQFKYCSHVRQGKPCWHQPGHCQSAQSEVEMAVWKAEHSGFAIRPHLLQLSSGDQNQSRQVTMFCKICLLTLSSPESFYKHCSSLEHAQLLAEDTISKWKGRNPPHNRRADFWLCERPQTCEYGSSCPKAHSEEELQEWLMRTVEEKEIRDSMEAQGLMCYNERILEEYKNSSNEVYIMSEHVDDVSISCDKHLTVECEKMNKTLKWNFKVETERDLVHVALLKQEPGASFTLGEACPVSCIYSSGEKFHNGDTTYNITVSFSSVNPGLYEQWLVLDFGMRPVLLKKLKVRVGQPSLDGTKQSTEIERVALKSSERWHRGNRIIIPCSSRTEEQDELLKEYKPPQISFLYKSSHNSHTPLNNDNYKERMHQFLYNEELAENEVVSRLNVCGEITTLDALFSPQSGMILAPPGELFCAASIPCNLTPDTPEGLALKRSIQSALIAPLPSGGPNSKVYEASIVPHKTNDNKIYLQLSKQCCSDLALKNKESYPMEVQFQLDRLSFCAMHRAIDLLPDTSRVLPDLKNCGVPTSNILFQNLNAKQQSAIGFITGNSNVQKSVAPLLIYGPFGTGKTFTLATAASELCKHPQNKVLICTHTNSSADLYVSDHFHQFISEGNNALKPIRIKANKQGSALRATNEITLKYCFLSEDEQSFLPPTKAVLDLHNIVITTTTMARYLHDLQLKEGYFTHILIDEASQMLECEALMALGLAGPNTRVALAGDHMQMGPKLFSVDEHHRSNHTLLTRLFHYYQGQKCDAAQNSRIIFSENYRSTKEIVEFVSTHFYVGKNDVIKATRDIPAPPNGHALNFHHVRGECLLDTSSMSWYNIQEVFKVVEAVNDILEQWPDTWGPIDQKSICVLSEGLQVRQIRSELSKRRFGGVHVETLANVQGKQFRTVILTTVQTRDSLTTLTPGMELFNDARVLNTAMTRAQSQVVVIGDAAALCCFGKCSEIWKSFIKHCISTNSVTPRHFSKDFFEKDVMETARFQRCQQADESDSPSDAILQELKDEYEQLKTEYSSDEENFESEDLDQRRSRMSYSRTDADTDLLELCKKHPDVFKRGTLFRETYKKGYVRPFHNPRKRIPIKGTANLRQVFTGDEVVLQTGRVISITKKAESARVLPCLLEDEDHSKPRQNSEGKFVKRLMIPLTKTEPKICILINKKRRNFIPIWQQINGEWYFAKDVRLNENLKQNSVFMVQVIAWRENCFYPLGFVFEILPIGTSLASALMILNEEFKVAHDTDNSDNLPSWLDEDESYRKDLRKRITFTVDPVGAKDLDDAISVRDIDSVQFELGIHIADVASFVSPDDHLDMEAKERGATYYCSVEKPKYMFPQHLSTELFSLLSGQDRRVVSLMFRIEKGSNKIIGKPTFQLSLIKSNKQLSYEKAEDFISEKYKGSLTFDTVEDCVAVAYCFAKAQRRIRLVDWAYYQCDGDRIPGKRKAHLMIEELSVLFNKYAAETLISSPKTRLYTPLRCQAEPDPEKVEELKLTCETLIPLSFHVRHRVQHDEQTPSCENFRILTEVWKHIQSAAGTSDTDKMVDLVAADDIHPLPQLVINKFKKCCSKAYFIRSNSSSEADVGHYSLSLTSYTQATSPIRRYMDIVLQRLLHSFICKKNLEYTRTEITGLCCQFEQNLKKANEYEQKAEQMSYAVSMKKQSATKLAFVVSAEPAGDSFAVSLPFNKNIFAVSLSIMYKDLQLEDQPFYDKKNHCIILKWRRRIYAADSMQMRQKLSMTYSGSYIELPLTSWKAITEAIDTGNLDHAHHLILDANPEQTERQIILPQCSEEPELQSEHFADIHFQLQPGDTLQIQMTSDIKRGYLMPAVQLVRIKPNFEICVDHVHSPITCFSKTADDPTRTHYSDSYEYVRIWEPLCKMESASTAVDESDSIIIENLVVNFKEECPGTLTGTFFLHLEWINKWAIECNLAKCLLCIRKRGLKLTSPIEHCAIVDPREFIWVVHGVTTNVESLENEGSKVTFYVNYRPMEDVPECVFQKNTCFTVEIIPKLLPDIRKENAVVNIPYACELVESIALGQRIPKEVKAVEQGLRRDLIRGLPEPNKSQRQAVVTALNNTFTLIQGPPGTGKTVVGVHIVRHFLKMNSENVKRYDDPKDNDKKQIILYCGPSNKSVDVVAEYLMKLKDISRPLRMYSQQVEMLDYPYPDGNLQFSQRTLRQERSKPELRSITLHHRMREKENIYSEEIKAFDQRIRLALEKKGEPLSTEEVKRYKKLLVDARKYELERHDIVLCTCTQSSTPSLMKTVIARQILIDECAMATEPQAMIPLVCNKPEKIVLIGDHKQLRPIVKNERVKKLGMAKSLFERYYTLRTKRTVMLDTQYRMHEDICEFPSDEFYEGKLKTGEEQPISILRVDDRTMPFVFGHIVGKTLSLVVSTAKGNENSKANNEERDQVVTIAEKLVKTGKIPQQSIVILSPYNAQVSEIRDELKRKKLDEIPVSTITKSQGSEWRYVIISTVVSLQSEEIETEPDRSWLSKHLGFVGDPNQINVAITRAKEGLCIIGNQELLRRSTTWTHLLQHYSHHGAVTDADQISVYDGR